MSTSSWYSKSCTQSPASKAGRTRCGLGSSAAVTIRRNHAATGSARAGEVAARLRRPQEATGADELVITTITHAHADRVRSYGMLAEHWNR
jgi:hypothetical protein